MNQINRSMTDVDKDRRKAAADYVAQIQRLRMHVRVQLRGASIFLDGKPHSQSMIEGMTERLAKQPDPIR